MKEYKIIKEFNAKTGVHINSQNTKIIWTKDLISIDELKEIHYSKYREDKLAMGMFSISIIEKDKCLHSCYPRRWSSWRISSSI
jgi:hypothetical protein